ncbi:hypothetical protein GCM10025861_27630 [Methanobacterium petrolearium]|nr:hypothetical protein GCM10025861_00200 [Methanobacterium petrolearium]BDZ72246.1 hypothetical protein GCM10025861_27630 [Methanobacterium petrolearium]
MKDKRKEILKDLLGEFGSEDDTDYVVEEEKPLPPQEKTPPIQEEEEEEFSLDKIMKKSLKNHLNALKKLKRHLMLSRPRLLRKGWFLNIM